MLSYCDSLVATAARGEVYVVGNSYVVVSRHLGTDVARTSVEDGLARRLVDSGHRVLMTPDLYHLPHGSAVWAEIRKVGGDLVVAGWLNPRPLACLVHEYAGRDPLLTLDLSADDHAFAAVEEALGPREGVGDLREIQADASARWYPVIDRSRCTSCRHCLQFCLFGVYETKDGHVVAVRPDNCKDGCPACARVCPQGAIIFPLCDEPAIAGAPGTIMQPDEAARRMYYVRTGRPCPACGQIAQPGDLAELRAGAPTCDECGGPIEEPVSSASSPVHEEIDSLIAALDDLAAGGDGE